MRKEGFGHTILSWYKNNKRDLPWRETKDPYKIWLSEVILQQTRVDQGMPYYFRFCERFPDVKKLADASEEEVLKLWQGLGYYSRARNLHAAAKQVCSEFNGEFPKTYEEILSLKGVGTYTAAAISSICFGERKAVVDGNVYRVLARIFGIETPIDSTAGKKEFQLLADSLITKKNPGDFNQAVMEFGARHCTPRRPQCGECPFAEACVALRENKVDLLPIKAKKTKVKERFLHYLVISDSKQVVIRKRNNPKDIWYNLHDFPLIESESKMAGKKAYAALLAEYKLNTLKAKLSASSSARHVLSHQILNAHFHQVSLRSVREVLANNKYLLCVDIAKLKDYSVPRLIDKFFESAGYL